MQGIVKGGLNDGGSNIKSIQTGAATVASGEGSATVTISSIDVTKSIVIVNGRESIVSPSEYGCFGGVITNSTTLTFNVTPTSGAKTLYWTVIEFNNVKSLQTGTLTASVAGTNSITISSINASKYMIFFSFKSSEGTNNTYESAVCFYRLLSPTSISFYSYDTKKTVYWQIIEFN